MDNVGFYVKAFISLIVLINPFEGIPVFLAGTHGAEHRERVTIARRACTAVTIVLLISLLLGRAILELFSITVGAFQIGGGIVLFLIAVRMVFSPSGPEPQRALGGASDPGFAIVPLAIPLMAGPGAIAGAILYGTRAHSFMETGILAAVVVIVGAAAYASLRAASVLARYLNDTSIGIITSITGLVIAAIAAEMVAHGIALVFGIKVFQGP